MYWNLRYSWSVNWEVKFALIEQIYERKVIGLEKSEQHNFKKNAIGLLIKQEVGEMTVPTAFVEYLLLSAFDNFHLLQWKQPKYH